MYFMIPVIWGLLAGSPFVTASPVPLAPDPIIITSGDTIIYLAEHPDHRVTVVVLCIFYASLLAFAQGESVPYSMETQL
jgi:hypothetical protein